MPFQWGSWPLILFMNYNNCILCAAIALVDFLLCEFTLCVVKGYKNILPLTDMFAHFHLLLVFISLRHHVDPGQHFIWTMQLCITYNMSNKITLTLLSQILGSLNLKYMTTTLNLCTWKGFTFCGIPLSNITHAGKWKYQCDKWSGHDESLFYSPATSDSHMLCYS